MGGSIAANLKMVRERIKNAADRTGRDPAAITLVAVTKTVGVDEIEELLQLGVRDFGENRAEAGLAKTAALGNDINWHFIGHLQRNKAKNVFPAFPVIHSVESPKLLSILDSLAAENNCIARVFLEINISGEQSKYGLGPKQCADMVRQAAALKNIDLCGLMTMAPFYDDPEQTRPVFRGLRDLRGRLQEQTGNALPCLSMGMSNDFEIAVEEGATHVRVGSSLFA